MRNWAYGAARGLRNLLAATIITAGLAEAEPVVIAALGDSLTQGYGLAPDQGFVPQLQRWLEAQGADVRLINAGVSGDTTQGGLARIGWTLTYDVQGVIVALGANDMLRGIDPATAKRNLAGIIQTAQDAGVQVLLVGFSAPLNYGPEYKTAFDAAYPALAEQFDVPLYPSFLAPLAQAIQGGAAFGAYMQADGLHPNADGMAEVVQAFGPHVLALAQQIDQSR